MQIVDMVYFRKSSMLTELASIVRVSLDLVDRRGVWKEKKGMIADYDNYPSSLEFYGIRKPALLFVANSFL